MFLLLKLPNCEKDAAKSKDFIKKFHKFTNYQFRLVVSWNIRKSSYLFRLKDKNLYPAFKIYYGKCQCGQDYVGEIIEILQRVGQNTTTQLKNQKQHNI